MRIPVWLTLGVAALVILFGVHRIRLSLRSEQEEGARARPRKGLYAMSRGAHRAVGVVYILLGAALVAATLGWNPFGDLFGRPPAKPEQPPASTNVPIETPPPAKK